VLSRQLSTTGDSGTAATAHRALNSYEQALEGRPVERTRHEHVPTGEASRETKGRRAIVVHERVERRPSGGGIQPDALRTRSLPRCR
jgi:hypothetical protein